MKREDLASRIRAIIVSFMGSKPLIYATLAVHDIVIVEGLPGYAATDGTTLYVDAKQAGELDDAKLALVLVHEALHAVLLHPARVTALAKKGIPRIIGNIAADAVVDFLMRGELGVGNRAIDEKLVTLDRVAKLLRDSGIPEDTLRRVVENPSLERLAQLLTEAARKICTSGNRCAAACPGYTGSHGLSKEFSIPRGMRVVSRAWRSIGGERERREARRLLERGLTRDAVRRMLELVKRIAESSSLVARKKAGHGKGVFERLVERLTRMNVSPASLAAIVAAGTGFNTRWSWSRLNKKLGELAPGRLRKGIDHVIVAIDVSGSISDDELSALSSFAYSLVSRLRPVRVTVVHWDYGIQSVKTMSGSPYMVASALKSPVAGGGGTSISEAISYAERRLKYGDVLVLCTDLFTIESPETLATRLERLKRSGVKLVLAVPEQHDADAFDLLKKIADMAVIVRTPGPGGVP